MITAQLYSMDFSKTFYDTLADKLSLTLNTQNNSIFYSKTTNIDTDLFYVTQSSIHLLQQHKNNIVSYKDFIFFDPRSNRNPIEISGQCGIQLKNEDYPQTCDDLTLIVYNISDITDVTPEFITLFKQNIDHQKKANKNNIVLNINSNLQHEPEIKELEKLLIPCNISGDLQPTPYNNYVCKNNKLLVFGSLAALLGFLYYYLQ